VRALHRLSPSERASLLDAPTLSLAETAQVLGVGLSALRDALRRDEIDLRVIRIGTRKVIPSPQIRNLLDNSEELPIDTP
jgi:hypothetical protein